MIKITQLPETETDAQIVLVYGPERKSWRKYIRPMISELTVQHGPQTIQRMSEKLEAVRPSTTVVMIEDIEQHLNGWENTWSLCLFLMSCREQNRSVIMTADKLDRIPRGMWNGEHRYSIDRMVEALH